MGLFSKLFGQKFRRGTFCDNCNSLSVPEETYLLTTAQVVSSEAFWEQVLTQSPEIHARDPHGDNWSEYVRRMADSPTPWQICQQCISLFEGVDRGAARQYSIACKRPPGTGPASLETAGLAAAYAWTKVYHSWPRSTFVGEGTITHDRGKGVTCDFCCRIITNPKEGIAIITSKMLDDFEKTARITHVPSLPQGNRHGEAHYLACSVCFKRFTQRKQ